MKTKQQIYLFIVLIILLTSFGNYAMTSPATKIYHYSIDVGAAPKYDVLFDFNHNYLTDSQGNPMLRFTAVGGSPASDWGDGDQSTLLSERNPLPTGIKVRWFSVVEDQFWEGEYQFNQNLLQQLSRYKVNAVTQRLERMFMERFRLVVYVVPGGLVTVWIKGAGNTYVLAQFQAHKVEETDWTNFSRVLQRGKKSSISRMDYIKERLSDPDTVMGRETQQEIDNGTVPTDSAPWKRFMNTYRWVLTVNDEFALKDYFARYTTAEQYYTYSDENQYTLKPRPVPKYLSYYIEDKTGQLHRLNLYLDPEETMSAFEKLSKESASAELIKLHLSIDSAVKNIDVFLIKDKQSIELKKIRGQIDDLYLR